MSERRVHAELRQLVAIPRRGSRDRFLVGLAVLVLVRTGEALASDPASLTGSDRPQAGDSHRTPSISASAFAIPESFSIPREAPVPLYSASDFRQRGPALHNSEPAPGAGDDSLLSETPVWQRLADFRALGRVRLLTLWQSSASSVSLQAGNKGSPSIQWTARLLNRGPGSSGLLDRLLPVSAIGEHHAASGASHSVPPALAAKSAAASGPAHPAPATTP